MTVTTKTRLKEVDIPTFFWLGESGLESLSEKEFEVKVKTTSDNQKVHRGEQDIGS